MSIWLRRVPGAGLVALCAAATDEKPGDRYLDDEEHYALAQKFWRDYGAEVDGLPEVEPEVAAAIAREEECLNAGEGRDK